MLEESKLTVGCITFVSLCGYQSSSSAKLRNRLLNLACPERPLTTKDPKPDILLPMDDEAWDQNVRYPTKFLLYLVF